MFTPNSVAGRHVQELLRENRDGLTLSDVRRQLRLSGYAYQDSELRALLSHVDTFHLHPDGRYQLTAFALPAEPEPVFPQPAPGTPSLVAFPLARRRHALLHLETGGTTPEHGAIRSISVRIMDGTQPVRHLKWEGCALSALQAALGDLPVVAHGQHLAFLGDALRANPVLNLTDLAALVDPTLSRHDPGSIPHTFESLVDRLDSLSEREHLLLASLLPELFGTGAKPGPVALTQTATLPPFSPPDLSVQHSFDTNTVTALLGEHLATRQMAPRTGQLDLVYEVTEALDDGRFKLLEAPTGTGKTLAYLTPATAYAAGTGERVVLSTAYRNLQNQLTRELDSLLKSSGLSVRYQVLKGASNYLCLRRLQDQLRQVTAETPEAQRLTLAYLARWSETGGAELDTLSPWLEQRASVRWDEICVDTRACSRERCPYYGRCGFIAAYQAAQEADLVITNHALLLSEPEQFPPYQHVVFDEAHTLEDVATAVRTQEVSAATLGRALARLRDRHSGKGVLIGLRRSLRGSAPERTLLQALGVVGKAESLVLTFGKALSIYIQSASTQADDKRTVRLRLAGDPRRIDPNGWLTVERKRLELEMYLNELISLVRQLQPHAADPDLQLETAHAADQLQEQRELLAEILTVRNINYAYWLEAETREDDVAWALKAAPVEVAPGLQNFYAKLRSAIFVSATLTVRDGDFSFCVDRLGLRPWLRQRDTRAVKGALNYRQNAFLGLTNYLEHTPVERDGGRWRDAVARELNLLCDFTSGRALVLFTARERLEYAEQHTRAHLAQRSIPVLSQGPGRSSARLLEEFAAIRESVLYGLRSFWEGVDVPGESLSFVIMEKLPFPSPEDPIISARRQAAALRGQHEFEDYLFPLMALQFKQGFGRLLRHQDDRGAVILLDRRVHRKAYRDDLLRSLPGFMDRNEAAERSRPEFYRELANRLPGLIDLEAKAALLASLTERAHSEFASDLDRFQLPDVIPEQEYPAYRARILEAIQALFGFPGFKSEAQEAAVRAMLAGRDLIGVLPTGAGKSLTFQLPALLQAGVTLVVSPLIALMKDQVDSLLEHDVEVAGALYSTQRADQRETVLERLRSGKLRLLYLSPERLRDPLLLESLASARLRRIVVDEAHCIAMWGPSFRPDFLYVPRLFDELGLRPPVAAVTATATAEIRDEIAQALTMRDPVIIQASVSRPELRLVVYNKHSLYNPIRSRRDKFRVLMRILRAAERTQSSVLVYVATTVEAELIARRLRHTGVDARAYHGKMDPRERDAVQELFMEDQIRVVVCTRAFGMGIDKPDIRYVIHYTMPGDIESYFQEAGRAGRDGQESYCVLLHYESDMRVHEYFADQARPDPEALQTLIDRLRRHPGDEILIDPASLCEDLDLEETGLRIYLHLLEQGGCIQRGNDVTLEASCTLIHDPTPDLVERGDQTTLALFKRLLDDDWLVPGRRCTLSVSDAAGALGVDHQELEDALIRLVHLDALLYRPWHKGMLLRKGALLAAGQPQVLDEAVLARQSERMLEKLEQMEAYAAGRSGERCLHTEILRYFGEAPAQPCGRCSGCDEDATWPWSGIMARDVGELHTFLDLPLTWLGVVAWNQQQMAQGHQPYGVSTLGHVLAGNDYLLRQPGLHPELQSWRLRRLRSCPLWGTFLTVPLGEQTIMTALRRLGAEGYVELQKAQVTEPEPFEYTYPILTPRGVARLQSGQQFRWPEFTW